MSERVSNAYIGSLRQEVAQIRQEVSEHEGRLNNIAFSAAQSNEAILRQMKESELLLNESTPFVEKEIGLRKKRKPPTEVPLFTFHGGSNDGDGGSPIGQEKRDAWRHKQEKKASARTLRIKS